VWFEVGEAEIDGGSARRPLEIGEFLLGAGQAHS
jgi:hypothetical protein